MIMGLFSFGKKEKAIIQKSAFKISLGFTRIAEELQKTDNHVTPRIKKIMLDLLDESTILYNMLCPKGLTDWKMINSIKVKDYNGDEIVLRIFIDQLYTKGKYLHELTGINITFNL